MARQDASFLNKLESTMADQQATTPKMEKRSPFSRQKSGGRADHLEISVNGDKPSDPKPERRSPFSLPKFGGGSKSLEDDSSVNKSSENSKAEKKKTHQRQKSEPIRTVLLVENVPCDVEPTFKEIVTGILPISYEDEIVQKRTQIMRDPLQDLLLFPQDDVVASTVTRELRTVHSTVPYDALSHTSDLFTRECIRFYTDNWSCIENKDASYSGSYLKLPRPAMGEGLQEQLFEMDMSDEVDSQDTEAPVSPLRQKGVSKQGYLTKAPFHGENESAAGGGGGSVAKTYKRRWFHLKQTSSDGSYILEYKKDDSNTNMARGVIYLDACTHISKGVKGRMYGFELHIQDKIYSLIADSQGDMDSWISAMCKVTGIDMDLSSNKSSFLPSFGGKLKAPKIHQSLRESLKNSKHPELQEFAKETDALNSKRRKDNRHKLFSLVRDLENNSLCVNIDDARIDADVFTEHFGERFVVECEELKFRLVRTNNGGNEINVEPFFTTLALFDVKRGIKLSEDFHCDLNDPSIRKMLVMSDTTDNEHLNGEAHNRDVHELVYKYPKKAVFSVTHPSPDVYLVVRIEKVLQGSISACTEPYLKSGDTKKTALKAHKMAEICCRKLGQYTMPFAWTARSLFTSEGKLDLAGEFTPIYKQDREKLGDEELVKMLSSFTSNKEKSVKQQVIPGNLQLSVKKLSEGLLNSLTPSLVPVRPFDDSLNEAVTVEAQEFCQSPEAAYPHTTYVNNLYVYPTSLNYNSQKVFSKARNISVTIEFRDSDGYDPQPLKCIYDKSGVPGFTTQVTAAVLHHCTNPTFYEEVKILLPTHMTDKHHLFFTFHHIACEQSKTSTGGSMKGKPAPIETPVGYAWMPVLTQGSPKSHDGSLMVAQSAPLGYLAAAPAGLGKVTGPDVKWVDRDRTLFRVSTRLVSTVYSQDPNVENFFAHCQKFDGSVVSEVELTKLLKLMYVVEVSTVVKFLPVIFNQLFHVLLVTNHEDSALNVVRVLIRIASQIHEANRLEILKSYIKYVFVTEQVPGSKKTIHEELTKYLMMCLKPGADPVVVNNLMKHSWFFFEVIVKCMAQTLVQTNKVKRINRDNWFRESYHKSLEHFLQAFVPQIISRLKEQPQIAKDANLHSACFIKDCFTYMDRGFVFQMISYYSEQFKESDTQMLEFKFEFLQVVCNHEHFIPLNLPLDVRALGGVYECELTEDYCKRYFLVGLLLREVSSALTQGRHIRKLSIRVLRNLLIKHELDERYDNEQKQARIATLYLPFLTILLNHAPRFQGSKHDLSQISCQLPQTTLTMSTSDYGSDSNRSSCQSGNVKQSPNNSLTQTAASTLKEASQIAFQVPLDEDETKELLLCFLYVIKNLESGVILDWWRQIMTGAVKRPHWHFSVWNYMADHHMSKFAAVIDVFDLLELALKHFNYKGRTQIEAHCASHSENTKQFLQQKYQGAYSTKSSLQRQSRSSSSGAFILDVQTRVLMEGNLSNEVGLIVLDTIELFCNHFKFHLEQDDGDNVLMKQIVSVLLSFLQIPQSEFLMKHVFASFRSFINKFPAALYKGSASHCGDMCREILCCCNSKLESLRTQACSFLYLLMRSNFEFSGGRGCDRVHWQVIVAISRLMASGLNRAAVNNSLQSLKDYASLDKGMKNTSFSSEVKDLTKKIYTVLQATAQMKEHDDIPEVLVDLQYSLAKSYSGTPELRETWLEHMAAVHEGQENYSETAMCYVHAAALVGEYLKRQDIYPEGCAAFRAVSPNVVPDESVMKTDEGMSMGQRYTESHFADLLEQCAKSLERAERYEVLGEIYKLVIPIYEKKRNFKALANAYENLSKAYKKVVEVMHSGRRMLGVFFRVAFFGQVFGDDDGKEYIYKEPMVTSLAEISHRLEEMYCSKHGKDNIKIILESSKVQADTLDVKIGHIQITYVEPYFEDDELSERTTCFERNHNIRRFIYETPFTASGKAHGTLTEQCKRKTVLTTSNTFPYVKKRILVVQEEQYELTPVEVAIDEMQNKVQELNKVISQSPPDMKRLQLILQGSVSVQVNAGAVAYVHAFLKANVVALHPVRHIEKLKQVFREFIICCGRALEINDQLIKSDQKMYQEDLKEKYSCLKSELISYVGELEDENVPKHASSSTSLSSLTK